jgi:hypothetical protein
MKVDASTADVPGTENMSEAQRIKIAANEVVEVHVGKSTEPKCNDQRTGCSANLIVPGPATISIVRTKRNS